MGLTKTHVRYLLVIYQLSKTQEVICSSDIAKLMGVKKPSVARMLGVLISKQLIAKEPYGKVHLTPSGVTAAIEYEQKIEMLRSMLEERFELTEQESYWAASVLICELPERCFSHGISDCRGVSANERSSS